jgi:aminoglycoside phosphotransferase (APT) family kinase protein
LVIRLEDPGGEIFLDTDIRRQALVMRALRAHAISAPLVIGYETDSGFIGRRFLVMERAEGRTFPQTPNYNHGGWVKDLTPHGRTELWCHALTTLGRANRLSVAGGLGFLDRPHYGPAGLDQYLGWLAAWRDDALGALLGLPGTPSGRGYEDFAAAVLAYGRGEEHPFQTRNDGEKRGDDCDRG